MTLALGFTYHAGEIGELIETLAFKPDQKRALFFAEKGRLDYVYHTAALEGNPFTFPEVKTLLEGVTVGGHKVSDAEQVLRLNRAHQAMVLMVKENHFQLNKMIACKFQALVAENEALTWGVFRNGAVSIAGTAYQPPLASRLDAIFVEGAKLLNQEQNQVLKALLIFLWGSLNQFFYDGNKRTSRFMANGVLLTYGLPPLNILAKDQFTYNKIMTQFYDEQIADPALTWLLGCYVQQIDQFGFI